MSIGAEIPFRRSHFPKNTGSRIFDHERAEHMRMTDQGGEPNIGNSLFWSKGKFLKR